MTGKIGLVPAKRIDFRGIPISYSVLGQGPLAVVTIGLGTGDQVAVSDQHRRVAETARVVVVRWPGTETLTATVAAIIAVLDAEKISSAVWWGSSIAGAMALFAAATAPSRVKGLIVASAALPVPKVARRVSFVRALMRFMPLKIIRKKILQRTGVEPGSPHAEILAKCLSKKDFLNWIGWAGDYHRLGVEPFLAVPPKGIPILIIGCEDDPSVPKAELDRLIAFFPNAVAKTFPDGGHFPQIFHRDEFERSILDFLSGLAV